MLFRFLQEGSTDEPAFCVRQQQRGREGETTDTTTSKDCSHCASSHDIVSRQRCGAAHAVTSTCTDSVTPFSRHAGAPTWPRRHAADEAFANTPTLAEVAQQMRSYRRTTLSPPCRSTSSIIGTFAFFSAEATCYFAAFILASSLHHTFSKVSADDA